MTTIAEVKRRLKTAPKPRIPRAVDLDKLTELCELVWQRPVEPRAAAYFARLMERQIRGFTPYLPNRRVTLKAVWDAASVYYA